VKWKLKINCFVHPAASKEVRVDCWFARDIFPSWTKQITGFVPSLQNQDDISSPFRYLQSSSDKCL